MTVILLALLYSNARLDRNYNKEYITLEVLSLDTAQMSAAPGFAAPFYECNTLCAFLYQDGRKYNAANADARGSSTTMKS